MTPSQREHLQHQAEILADECKRHRRTARELRTLRSQVYIGASHCLSLTSRPLNGFGCAVGSPEAQAAIADVTAPLRGDILRAAEMHAQELSRHAFIRLSLIQAQLLEAEKGDALMARAAA